MCFIHVCAWRPGNNTESPVLLFPSSLQCLSLNLEQSWWASHPSGPPVLAKLALVTGIFTTSTGYRCEYHQQGLQVWAPPALVTSGNTTSTGYRCEHHQHGLQVWTPPAQVTGMSTPAWLLCRSWAFEFMFSCLCASKDSYRLSYLLSFLDFICKRNQILFTFHHCDVLGCK